jgi:hypothetical protein
MSLEERKTYDNILLHSNPGLIARGPACMSHRKPQLGRKNVALLRMFQVIADLEECTYKPPALRVQPQSVQWDNSCREHNR